ncbi:MAG: immunoglobulin domain-containing protein, partial [Firmicutes bacterium]|nr:immunoglobulin domain-containing protein [Bacillota bacterium]
MKKRIGLIITLVMILIASTVMNAFAASAQLIITTQPKNIKAEAGETVKMTVKAQGDDLSYQWQIKTAPGKNWIKSTASSGKTASLNINVISGRDGYAYRCVITDGEGNKVTSKSATLTVVKAVEKLTITEQ